MAENKIYKFSETDTGTNLLDDAEYQADPQRAIGNQPGIARSKLVNKALRQSAFVANGVAEFIKEITDEDVSDSDSTSEFVEKFNKAVSIKTKGIPTWDETTVYSEFDVVIYNGTTYTSLFNDNVGNNPEKPFNSNFYYWDGDTYDAFINSKGEEKSIDFIPAALVSGDAYASSIMNTLPTGQSIGTAFSKVIQNTDPKSCKQIQFFACTHVNSPFVSVYQIGEPTTFPYLSFTKLANPGTLPGSLGRYIQFISTGHFPGVYFGMICDTSPYFILYRIEDNLTITKIATTFSSAMPNQSTSQFWAYNETSLNAYYAFICATGDKAYLYYQATLPSTTLTKMTIPNIPTNASYITMNSNATRMVVANNQTTNQFSIYEINNLTVTKINTIDVGGANQTGKLCKISPDGKIFALVVYTGFGNLHSVMIHYSEDGGQTLRHIGNAPASQIVTDIIFTPSSNVFIVKQASGSAKKWEIFPNTIVDLGNVFGVSGDYYESISPGGQLHACSINISPYVLIFKNYLRTPYILNKKPKVKDYLPGI